MVVDELLHVSEDLGVALMGSRGHSLENILVAAVVGGGRLRVENKRDGQETFDPFNQLVSAMSFESVFNAIARRHDLCDRTKAAITGMRIGELVHHALSGLACETLSC